jgi:hypothetical protein
VGRRNTGPFRDTPWIPSVTAARREKAPVFRHDAARPRNLLRSRASATARSIASKLVSQ